MNEDVSELNAHNRYYVEPDTCVHHECCVETAPNNFEMHGLTAYVFKQPGTPEEEAQCRRALEQCPTAAIRAWRSTAKILLT